VRPILLIAVAAVIASCGQDSADDYREKAVALCEEGAEKAEAIDLPRSQDEISTYLEKVFREFERLDDEFAALDPPDELASLHERAVEMSDRAEGQFRQLIRRVETADNPVATLRRELETLLGPLIRQSERLNRRMGLEECNEVGLPGGDEQAPS
jgi:hypothetical protein